jgi:hypothetical protein
MIFAHGWSINGTAQGGTQPSRGNAKRGKAKREERQDGESFIYWIDEWLPLSSPSSSIASCEDGNARFDDGTMPREEGKPTFPSLALGFDDGNMSFPSFASAFDDGNMSFPSFGGSEGGRDPLGAGEFQKGEFQKGDAINSRFLRDLPLTRSPLKTHAFSRRTDIPESLALTRGQWNGASPLFVVLESVHSEAASSRGSDKRLAGAIVIVLVCGQLGTILATMPSRASVPLHRPARP